MIEVKEYEKKTMSGECRYCGEFRLVQAADEKEANLLATEQCTCEGATKERDRRNSLMRLRAAMQDPEENSGFPPLSEGIQGVVENLAELILDHHIGTANIDTGDRQIKIKMADGGLKFQQVKKIEMEELC